MEFFGDCPMRKNKLLNKRLQGFRTVYMKSSKDFLLNYDISTIKREKTFWNIRVDAVLDWIPEGWEDVVQLLKGWEQPQEVLDFKERVLNPIDAETTRALDQLYKDVYRSNCVDFNLPQAPRMAPILQKISLREYRFGQLQIYVSGHSDYRILRISAYGTDLIEKEVFINLRQAEKDLEWHIPYLKAINRLMDWSCFNNLTLRQREALRLKSRVLDNYYFSSHLPIDEKINRKGLLI